MSNKRKHVLKNLIAKLISLPLILDEMFLMDLLAIGANLVASHYAEILVNASIDELIRYSKCL